jgi:hypothetical protein
MGHIAPYNTDLRKPQGQKERTKIMNELPEKCRPIEVHETEGYDIEVLGLVNTVGVRVIDKRTGERYTESFLSNTNLGKPGNKPWYLVRLGEELIEAHESCEDWATFLITDESVYHAAVNVWDATSCDETYGFAPLKVLPRVYFGETGSPHSEIFSLWVYSGIKCIMTPSVKAAIIEVIKYYTDNLDID